MSNRRLRVFPGIQPSGVSHVGNYLGAIRNWVNQQELYDNIFCIVNLHALSLPTTRDALLANTVTMANTLLAAGIDPKQSILFVQSDVREHAELCWLLNSVTQFGELRRMTQFKDKTGGQGRSGLRGPVRLPGAASRRHPALRHRSGAGRQRPEAARRADPRHRRTVQRPLRRDVRGAQAGHQAGGRADHGPGRPGQENEQEFRQPEQLRRPRRRRGHDHPQDQARRDRLGRRGTGRRRQTGAHQSPRHLLPLQRQVDSRNRTRLRRQGLRRLQEPIWPTSSSPPWTRSKNDSPNSRRIPPSRSAYSKRVRSGRAIKRARRWHWFAIASGSNSFRMLGGPVGHA